MKRVYTIVNDNTRELLAGMFFNSLDDAIKHIYNACNEFRECRRVVATEEKNVLKITDENGNLVQYDRIVRLDEMIVK